VEVGGQRHIPAAFVPERELGTYFTGDCVGPKADLEGPKKISPPAALDTRTVKSVASRYIDWTVSAYFVEEIGFIKFG
jgi:hypothetical protein